MDYKEIKKIFLHTSETGENITGLEWEKAEKVQHEVGERLKELAGEKMYIDTVESIVSTSEAAMEEFGFITGFQTAVRLMIECGLQMPEAVKA